MRFLSHQEHPELLYAESSCLFSHLQGLLKEYLGKCHIEMGVASLFV